MHGRSFFLTLCLAAITVLLFAMELAFGSVHIPLRQVLSNLFGNTTADESQQMIVLHSRLPRACAAAIGGAALALAGLLMQTLFRNPLAGPSVLGITSGSSLAVALLVLGGGGVAGVLSSVSIAMAACAGAVAVLLVIAFAAQRLNDNVSLLIFGIMLGYAVGAVESVLQFNASKEALRSFVMWGMGNFSSVTEQLEVIIMFVVFLVAACVVVLLLPQYNLFLMGEEAARSMGVNTKRLRTVTIIITALLAGVVTAFCGPVAFIGLAVPHIVRMVYGTSNHLKIFVPVMICGACAALLCDFISRMPWSSGFLPLNAVTSLLGAPVVIYILLRGRNSKAII